MNHYTKTFTLFQVGGNFKCPCNLPVYEHNNLSHAYTMSHKTLQEKADHVSACGDVTVDGKINPNNMSKEQMAKALSSLGKSTLGCTKEEMKKMLIDEMQGDQRTPPLLSTEVTLEQMDALWYEVLNGEFMHDFVAGWENMVTELPLHLPEPAKKALTEFFIKVQNGKDRTKAADSRRYAILFCSFCHQRQDIVGQDVYHLSQVLVELSSIAYSNECKRTERQVLRFHNLTFIYGMYLLKLIGDKPKKMSTAKLYGIHFHDMTAHAAITYRIVSHKSVIPEKEEGSFYTLKQITENTSSRRPDHVVPNAMIRMAYQEKAQSSSRSQEASQIGRLSKKVLLSFIAFCN